MSSKIIRIKTGIDGLDSIIEGGFEKGSTVMVNGTPGSGKTIFGLQYLYYGAKELKEPGIFISFEETREEILRNCSAFGWNIEELEEQKLFKILEYKPHQVNKLMQEGGGIIKDTIKDLKAKRIAIDSITAYAILFKEEYEQRETLMDFFEMIKRWGLTSVVISESNDDNYGQNLGFLTDAIIAIRYDKTKEGRIRERTLEVLKMRDTNHSNKIYNIEFDKSIGINLILKN